MGQSENWRIVQTIAANNVQALFLSISTGRMTSFPIAVWATVENEEGETKVRGMFYGHIPNLVLIRDDNEDFWKYAPLDIEVDPWEIKGAIKERRDDEQSMLKYFVIDAAEDEIISEELSKRFVDDFSYPYKVDDLQFYEARNIAHRIAWKGFESWEPESEDNQAIKKLFERWDEYEKDEMYFDTKEEVTDGKGQ